MKRLLQLSDSERRDLLTQVFINHPEKRIFQWKLRSSKAADSLKNNFYLFALLLKKEESVENNSGECTHTYC